MKRQASVVECILEVQNSSLCHSISTSEEPEVQVTEEIQEQVESHAQLYKKHKKRIQLNK